MKYLVVAIVLIGSCQDRSSADAPGQHQQPRSSESSDQSGAQVRREADAEAELLACEPPLECSMAGQACPSAKLPRFSSQLDAAGWKRLRELAEQGLVAVVLGERVELVAGCRLPGRYHEAVAAPDSPGRAWSADRLSLLPDEPRDCGRATHFVASFAVRGELDGAAVALPLPCPRLGSGTPRGCIGVGLDDAAREAEARSRWERAESLVEGETWAARERALPLMLELTALMPTPWAYQSLASLLRYLESEQHGGCLWVSEAEHAARSFNPDAEPPGERTLPSHDRRDCDTQPSLLTCFPERFTPGTGDNCW